MVGNTIWIWFLKVNTLFSGNNVLQIGNIWPSYHNELLRDTM